MDEEDSEEAEKLAELSNPTRRVLGPALPPQVLLDQAAEVAEAVSSRDLFIASFVQKISIMTMASGFWTVAGGSRAKDSLIYPNYSASAPCNQFAPARLVNKAC